MLLDHFREKLVPCAFAMALMDHCERCENERTKPLTIISIGSRSSYRRQEAEEEVVQGQGYVPTVLFYYSSIEFHARDEIDRHAIKNDLEEER